MLRSSFGLPGAGALGLLLAGALTGVIKVPGFGSPPTPPPTPPHPQPQPQPQPQPVPYGPSLPPSKGTIGGGALSAQATLGQAKLVRGENGELLIHIGVDATSELANKERRPIDLALVLDVSGSMNDENKIGLLKQACHGIVQRLRDDDRIAVVAFSNDARVVWPLQDLKARSQDCVPASSKKQLESVIESLVANGGTNIAAGLLAGAEELRKVDPRAGAARRVILLTDGLATVGVQDPKKLQELTGGVAREGFTISTVGLGLEYNENLLANMADSGRGGYYHAEIADKLARIYDAEIDATRGLVARDARITIAPVAGTTIDSVYLWGTNALADGSTEVLLGDLSAGRHVKVVARLKVPTTGEAPGVDVVRVSLRYQDVRDARPQAVATGTLALGVELVNDQKVASASVANEVKPAIQQAQFAVTLETARVAALKGNTAAVTTAIDQLKKDIGTNVFTFQGQCGDKQTVNLDECAAGLIGRAREAHAAPGMAAPAAERWAKIAKETNQGAK